MEKIFIIIILNIFLLVVIILYLYYEKNTLDVTMYNINNKKIPKSFDKYKIIQVSDFHSVKNKKLVNAVIDNIKKEKPNIIVITGDLVSNSKNKNIESAVSFIKMIDGIASVYFVSGNHESKINNYDKLKDMLNENGVIILNNKTKKIKHKNKEINLIGIDDPTIANRKNTDNSNIIKEELFYAKYSFDKFNILLSNRPELFDVYVDNNIDLILSGHTHGGQVRIPFIGAICAPNQGLFPKYDCGLFKSEDTTMIVSRGIGTSKLPIRINDKPELVVISLETR